MAGPTPTHPGLRVMDRVTVDENGCWRFEHNLDRDGYGHVSQSPVFGPVRKCKAHRATWAYFNGPIPPGLDPDHLCKVPCCTNPGHLELVTPLENTRRGNAPAVVIARSGRCREGHPMNEINTYLRPDGHRTCRPCRRIYKAQWRAQRTAEGLVAS